ncbi:adenylate/guanylate cyclase domain-containing protein [Solimonas marina]|uniref:Adenylate/guanylate cyclase domain-containing protein n=1 Tax=Solimonas marina TaxID=2714601 RepID=A0A969WAZ5_9GAMM|nr:adenylate/guanylate cyclase domain-containing protein [Solimonas marina]
MSGDIIANSIVALVALGMGLAFVSADRRSPTSRALAAAYAFIGLSIYLNLAWTSPVPELPWWTAWFALPEAAATITMLEWIIRVRRTVPVDPDLDPRFGDRVLRSGQIGGLLYGLFSLMWPDIRISHFLRASSNPEVFLSGGFWLFALPLLYATLSGTVGILLLLRRRPERAETIRVLAMALAVPFLSASFILPVEAAAISVILGEIIFFIGSTHYHVLQGQRGQFMSRFLSPQVAKLVAEQGLQRAMQESQREISIVCCDLRGFTPYAAAQPSAQVLQVLREYYDAVGDVVSNYGATIKDFAGDGILILVGAPLPMAYHAPRALEMAARIREAGETLTQRWSTVQHPLGIGLGVATGVVTVGVIGSASRLEYTAVGSAVNLASRLCEQAGSGEILVDARTADLAGADRLQQRDAVTVKGFAEPVPRYALG